MSSLFYSHLLKLFNHFFEFDYAVFRMMHIIRSPHSEKMSPFEKQYKPFEKSIDPIIMNGFFVVINSHLSIYLK